MPNCLTPEFCSRFEPRESLAVRLRQLWIEALDLKEGDDIEIRVAASRDFIVSRAPDRQELLGRLRALRGRLPTDFGFDRSEANARQLPRHQRSRLSRSGESRKADPSR